MNLKELKRKVMIDTLLTPTTLVLGTIGAVGLLFGWALSSAATVVVGVLGLLGAAGTSVTSFFSNFDEMADRAVKAYKLQEIQEKETALDELDANLKKDRDPRDQTYLREIRAVYKTFLKDIAEGKYCDYVTNDTLKQLEEMFQAVVASLKYSYDLWEDSNEASGDVRKRILQEREHVITEVGASVERMTASISNIRALSFKSKKEDLRDMRDRLKDNLEIARRTQERVQALEKPGYERFEAN